MQIEQCIHFTNALWSLTAFAFCLVHVRLYISMLYFVVWTPAEKIYGRNSSDGAIVSDWLTIIILTLGFCSFLQRIRWSLSGSDLTSTSNNRKSRRTTCVATCHSRGGSIRSVSSMQCRGKIQMETGSLMPTWVPSCDRFMVTVKARSKAFINNTWTYPLSRRNLECADADTPPKDVTFTRALRLQLWCSRFPV